MKRLEARIFERMAEFPSEGDTRQARFSFVTARQFYGLDINPFAVELAKVTMMIARKLAIDELHIAEQALPLDNLDANFQAGDALIDDLGNPAQWPKADVIIGNPPFLGAKRLKPERGPDYVNAVRKATPTSPAWPTTASTGSARPTTTCPPARPTTRSPAAPASSARRTSATTSPASAAWITSSRTARSSRRWTISRGVAKRTSTFRSRTG